MTLDEAIKHCHEKAGHLREGVRISQSMTAAEQADCLECAKEHEQLASWLEELRERREADRWVPVSERLPEEGTDVLVCGIYGDITLVRDFFTHYTIGWGFDLVKAWMPLPEPYKEGGGKE